MAISANRYHLDAKGILRVRAALTGVPCGRRECPEDSHDPRLCPVGVAQRLLAHVAETESFLQGVRCDVLGCLKPPAGFTPGMAKPYCAVHLSPCVACFGLGFSDEIDGMLLPCDGCFGTGRALALF
jgi:hypothetical protein